jgi:hypothetical protein
MGGVKPVIVSSEGTAVSGEKTATVSRKQTVMVTSEWIVSGAEGSRRTGGECDDRYTTNVRPLSI